MVPTFQLSSRNWKFPYWNLNPVAIKQASQFLVLEPFCASLCCKAPLTRWHWFHISYSLISVKRMYTVQNINGIDAREEKTIKLNSIEMRETIAFIHLRHPVYWLGIIVSLVFHAGHGNQQILLAAWECTLSVCLWRDWIDNVGDESRQCECCCYRISHKQGLYCPVSHKVKIYCWAWMTEGTQICTYAVLQGKKN